MDNQLKIIQAAKARGFDPANLTPSQYRSLSLEVRSTRDKIIDGARALKSRAKHKLGVGQMPVPVAEANKRQCESNECGRFRLLNVQHRTKNESGEVTVSIVGQRPACDACNCHNRWLEAKWGDNTQECPLVNPNTGKKYWSNRGA